MTAVLDHVESRVWMPCIVQLGDELLTIIVELIAIAAGDVNDLPD